MAIQNFVSGGYYGKLGVTVGQRWKNIRTIRSYVIPHDPKTPAQLEQRGQFGQAVKFSQIGNASNYETTAFTTPDNTVWAMRMSCARNLIAQGNTFLNLIPLYPIGFTLPYYFNEVKYGTRGGSGSLSLKVAGSLPSTERALIALVYPEGVDFDPDNIALFPATFNPAEENQITIPAPYGDDIQIGDKIRFISIDDEDSTVDLIGGAQVEVASGSKPVSTFDTSVYASSIDNSGVLVVFNQAFETFESVSGSFVLSYIAQGVQQTKNLSISALRNENGRCGILFDIASSGGWDKPALPSGSSVQVVSLSAETSTQIYEATPATIAVQNADLTRNVSIGWANNPQSGKAVSLNSSFRSASTISKTLAISFYEREAIDEDNKIQKNGNATLAISSSGCTLVLNGGSGTNYPAQWNCSCSVPSFTETLNGVNYVFGAESVVFTNLYTQFKALEFEDPYAVGRRYANGKWNYDLFVQIASDGEVSGNYQTSESTEAMWIFGDFADSGSFMWDIVYQNTGSFTAGGYLRYLIQQSAYEGTATKQSINEMEVGVDEDYEADAFGFTLSYGGLTYNQPVSISQEDVYSPTVFDE